MISIRSLGHACFSLTDGRYTVVFDPWLEENPDAVTSAAEVKADALLVSHGHLDHLGDAISISKSSGALIIAPYELAMYCQRHGAQVHPLHIGGGRDFPFGRVKLVQATHGSAVVEEDHIEYTGPACGFLLTMGGKNIYYAGDTGLFSDMKLLGDRYALDVAILPIGDNFTMGIEDAVEATKLLRPKTVIPMHYHANELILQDPQVFAREVGEAGLKCTILEPGQSLDLET